MRVAMLGLGGAARRILIPSVRAKSGLRIEAACDPDPVAREEAARLGVESVHATAAEAIAASHPELVVVATPPDSHHELCRLGLAAGAHVFCEKPFVPSVAEANDIIAAAKRAGRQVAVNNQYYMMPIFSAFHRALRDESIGELLFISAWHTMLEPPPAEMGWRGRLRRRTLYEFGTHAIDLILHFFGERPRAVTASLSGDGGEKEWDAFCSVTLHFSRDRIATLVTDRVSRGRWRYLDFRAEGRRGTLRASLGGEARLAGGIDGLTRVPFVSLQLTKGGFAWLETGERRRVLARNPANPMTDAAGTHLSAFVDAVRAERPFERSAEQNRAAIEAVAAAYLSAEEGRRIDLDRESDAISRVKLC